MLNVLLVNKMKRDLIEAERNKKNVENLMIKCNKLLPGPGIALFKNVEKLGSNEGVRITYEVYDTKNISNQVIQIYKWGTFTGDKLQKIWTTMNIDSDNLVDLIGAFAEVEINYNKEYINLKILAPYEFDKEMKNTFFEDDEDDDYEV